MTKWIKTQKESIISKIDRACVWWIINVIQENKFILDYLAEEFKFLDNVKVVDLNEVVEKWENLNIFEWTTDNSLIIINDFNSIIWLKSINFVSALENGLSNNRRLLILTTWNLDSDRFFIEHQIIKINLKWLLNWQYELLYKLSLFKFISQNFEYISNKKHLLSIIDELYKYNLTDVDLILIFIEFLKQKDDLNLQTYFNWKNFKKYVKETLIKEFHEILLKDKDDIIFVFKKIKEKIIWQDDPILDVLINIYNKEQWIINWPLTFMFTWETWVGKTELAKQLALNLYWGKDKLIKISANEIQNEMDDYWLFWSKPWYVGYWETETLVDKIKRIWKKWILLFDEIEKAHDKFFDRLMEIIEEWIIIDGKWEEVDIKDWLIIFTTNQIKNLNELEESKPIWFYVLEENKDNKTDKTELDLESKIINKLKERFKPEFLNRINWFILFNSLDDNSLLKIIDKKVKEINEKIKGKTKFKLTKKEKEELIKNAKETGLWWRYIVKKVEKLFAEQLKKEMIKIKKEILNS